MRHTEHKIRTVIDESEKLRSMIKQQLKEAAKMRANWTKHARKLTNFKTWYRKPEKSLDIFTNHVF
jgi:hypothetical protein